MTSVVLYFQVHQPFRLKHYSIFDQHPWYFDSEKNAAICRKVADKCYRPATTLILDLLKKNKGAFRVSYSLTGTVLDQLEEWCPDVIELFKRVSDTGCCEFLAETSHHSLAFLYSRQEFQAQVDTHARRIHDLFGHTPTVFRNTELIYANELARELAAMRDASGIPRFKGALCEGVDRLLGYRSPNYVYRPPLVAGQPIMTIGTRPRSKPAPQPFGLLLKNHRLSDDIAFRFSNTSWAEWPLSAEKFAGWISEINGDGFLCNLFMDYETFGEHQWATTGIFDFLRDLPARVFDARPGDNHFITPGMALDEFEPVGEYDVPEFISWADTERDLSAWRGNAMQSNALEECFRLERPIKQRLADAEHSGDRDEIAHARFLLEDWRRLTTSDHFYYMCTKRFSDGDVHSYFSPYDSPYEGYINYMNVLDNVRQRVTADAITAEEVPPEPIV